MNLRCVGRELLSIKVKPIIIPQDLGFYYSILWHIYISWFCQQFTRRTMLILSSVLWSRSYKLFVLQLWTRTLPRIDLSNGQAQDCAAHIRLWQSGLDRWALWCRTKLIILPSIIPTVRTNLILYSIICYQRVQARYSWVLVGVSTCLVFIFGLKKSKLMLSVRLIKLEALIVSKSMRIMYECHSEMYQL